MTLLLAAAALVIVATALIHSVLGERRIMPALHALGTDKIGRRARRALRFTWHLASLLMLVIAATVAWPGTPTNLVRLIGVFYLLLGITALWLTRGRHISGPAFTGAGVLALLGSGPFAEAAR